MIPKKIHYCWFGGKPLNALGEKCLASWKKFFPDYEIIEWNESNFDINCCAYVQEAYAAKKWAFVSDYARLKILHEYGGVYFDTDVEVIRPMEDIIFAGGFMACEQDTPSHVAPGLGLAAEPGLELYKELLEEYHSRHFLNEDGSFNLKTIVEYTTDSLRKHGLTDTDKIQFVAGISVYPKAYFNPMDMSSGRLVITQNTRSIHHYAASWESKKNIFRGKVYRFIYRCFGEGAAEALRHLLGKKS